MDSLIELDELYKTVQQRVDGVQKWSVHSMKKVLSVFRPGFLRYTTVR